MHTVKRRSARGVAGVKPSSLVEEAEELLRAQQQAVEAPVVELSQAERYAHAYCAQMVMLFVSAAHSNTVHLLILGSLTACL